MAGFTDTLLQRPLVAIVLINTVISILIYHANPVINFDGIVYLSSAQAMLDGRWQDAFSIYRWPFYPLLIALTSKLIPNLEIAAHFVNFVLFNLLTLGFFYCAKSLGATSKTLLLSALLIGLFFPSLLKFRAFLIRDIGFWVGFIWSVYFAIQYHKTNKSMSIAGWSVALIVAGLFRLEALAYLTILPLLYWASRAKSIFHKAVPITSLAISLLAISIGMYFWHDISWRISLSQVLAEPRIMLDLIKNSVSNIDPNSFDLLSDTTRALSQLAYETIRRSSILYLILAIYAVKKTLLKGEQDEHKVVLSYAAVSLLIPMLFATGSGFLVSRYVMPLVLLIALVSVFAFPPIIEQARFGPTKIRRSACVGIMILLGAMSADRFSSSKNQIEIMQAGNWVKTQNYPPQDLYSNNAKIIYYAGGNPHPTYTELYSTDTLVNRWKNGGLKSYSVLAIVARKGDTSDQQLVKDIRLKYGVPRAVFEGERGDSVQVFIRPNTTTL